MKVTEQKLIRTHQPDRAPVAGFTTYVSATEPIILRRLGWEIGNDIHDHYTEEISRDNGATWGEPRAVMVEEEVEGGTIIHTENAALFHAKRNLLFTFTNHKIEPDTSDHSMNDSASVMITRHDLAQGDIAAALAAPTEPFISDFGLPQGLYVSFCDVLLDSNDRILVPVQWQKRDLSGECRAYGLPARTDMPDVMQDVWEGALLIGEFQADGEVAWELGGTVPCAFLNSSRGMCEPTVAELEGGTLVMVLRGSNAAWLDRPSYKWVSFSIDGGLTWSEATPLYCDDGALFQSSATGSTLIRCERSGKLYWIGNICADGGQAQANYPRTPLYVVEVQEEPFALKRATLTIIDQQQPGELPVLQLSNFRVYQDRATGEFVLLLTRYAERGHDNLDWMKSDQYQYRVALP